MLDSVEYHLFPNMFFFPGITIPMAYRFRPNGDDVDSSIFDLMILEPLAEGEPHPEQPDPVRVGGKSRDWAPGGRGDESNREPALPFGAEQTRGRDVVGVEKNSRFFIKI